MIITADSPDLSLADRLALMAATDEPVLGTLDRVWKRVREENSDVPDLSFAIRAGRTSGCGAIDFSDAKPVMVLNLLPGWDGDATSPDPDQPDAWKVKRDEHKMAGTAILERLLHQAAHGVVHVTHGPVTATEGRWHSESYRDVAQGLGLTVERGSDVTGGSGWNKTSLGPAALSRYRHEITALDKALAAWNPEFPRKRKRGAVKMTCSCQPPRILWVSSGVAEAGQIRCGICNSEFTLSS